MPYYRPEPPHNHLTPASTAVVLVNLGTPEAPTAAALRAYLGEFLWDRRVVEIPRALWWLILHGIILRVRPAKSAAKYASIWQQGGSPLKVHTVAQAEALQTRLTTLGHHVTVRYAMRYGQPALPRVLDELKAQGCERILLVPLYPQYAASTTATILDVLACWLQRTRNQPALRTVKHFHDDPGYIHALAAQVRAHWDEHGPLGADDRLLISFHGLPKRSLDLGDPYFCECQKTGRLLRDALGLLPEQVHICFQSRFGRAEWLQPYTAQTVQTLGQTGIRRLDVICPGFVADCLETLEEIAQEVRADFLHAGGQVFHYIPCLNTSPPWVDALTSLVEKQLQGWPTILTNTETQQATQDRAMRLGAPR